MKEHIRLKMGLIITGLGLVASSLFFMPEWLEQSLGNSPGLYPFIGAAVFLLGDFVLSFVYGDKMSHWISVVISFSWIFWFILGMLQFTPPSVNRYLFIIFCVSSVGLWLHLVYLYKLKT